MKLKAYAKINLGLDVIRRREDGYHEVRMIMQNVGLYDELEVNRTENPGIVITTDRDDLPVNEDNLIYKAAKLLIDEFGISEGVSVHLCKNIPVAAGLAGGSTDAAATLKCINEIFELGLSTEELMKRGVQIGADVPYCILGGTALSEGIGEVLTSLNPCPECYVLLAKPPVSVSTKHVYQSLNINTLNHPDIDGVISGINNNDISEVASHLGNVLESVTVYEHPEINELKKMMLEDGAVASLMSGSGPTVFGLFTDDELAEKCAMRIKTSGIAKDVELTVLVKQDK